MVPYSSALLPVLLVLGFSLLFLATLGLRLCYLFEIFLASWGRLILLLSSLVELLFAASQRSWSIFFHLHFFLCIFKFLLWFLVWPIHCFIACYVTSMYLWYFQIFSCGWFLVSLVVVRKNVWYNFDLLNLLRLILWPNTRFVLENIHCTL